MNQRRIEDVTLPHYLIWSACCWDTPSLTILPRPLYPPCTGFHVLQVAFDKGVRARTVTLDGDTFEPQGTLTGGSKAQLGVVLGRLAELQSASRELGVHEERLRGVADKIGRLSAASKKVCDALIVKLVCLI